MLLANFPKIITKSAKKREKIRNTKAVVHTTVVHWTSAHLHTAT